MSFLLPIGLAALVSLPLVLLLHMIRQRRRRVAVPSLLLWANLPRTQEGERARRLPLTLLLLLHLLAAALLALALGRPQLLGAVSDRPEQTAIVIDTSLSMLARAGAGSRFDQAREQARTLLRTMGPEAHITLISAGQTADIVASGGQAELANLLEAVDRLRAGSAGSDLASALTLAEAALDPQRSARMVVLTDGATPTIGSRTINAPVDWRQVGETQPNRAVVAFAARPFGNNLQVYARVANYGNNTFAATLRLFADNRTVDTRSLAFNPDGETELTWQVPTSARELRIALDGADALPQDDQALLNLATVRPTNVLLVSGRPDVLRRALEAVPGVTVTIIAPSSYSPNTREQQVADLTVFDTLLPTAWPPGATLAINPPPGGLLPIQPGPRQLSGQELTTRGALLDGLSLGGVNFGVAQPLTPPAWAETLLSAGETPLIVRGRDGEHEIAVWAFDLAASNLPNRLAFPLLVARTVRDLTPSGLPASIPLDGTLMVRPSTRTADIRLVAPDDSGRSLPAAPIVRFDRLEQPGWYRLIEQGAGGQVFEGRVPVNAGSPLESDLRPQPRPQFTVTAPGATLETRRSGVEIWPWLALAALAVLALEWLYVHRRHATAW